MALISTGPGPDGCSGGVSRLWRLVTGNRPPFEWCCDEHDLAYDEGGNPDDRRLADRRLRECVAMSGHPVVAWIMWIGVRIGSWPFWGQRREEEKT